jgi:DNA-binding response OmpR family regulator
MTTPAPAPEPVSKPASILVIDDNMDTADSLARFLRIAIGHKVRVAYDGPTGIRLAGEIGPDVVICDIAMPKLSGLGVATALGNMNPKPLLIAVTAFAGEFPEAKAKEAGFDFYLAKPADPFVIDALIQNRDRRPASPAST